MAYAKRTIWASELLNSTAAFDASNHGDSMEIEAGFGFEVLDDSLLLTPYSAFGQAKSQASEFQIGNRLKSGEGVDLGVRPEVN